jgi:predicted DNA-binding protein
MEARIGVRLSESQARKLEALQRTTRRTKSQIVRLLIDAAVSDNKPDVWLDDRRLEAKNATR